MFSSGKGRVPQKKKGFTSKKNFFSPETDTLWCGGVSLKIFFPPQERRYLPQIFFSLKKTHPKPHIPPKQQLFPQKRRFHLKKGRYFALILKNGTVMSQKKNLKKGGVCLKKKVFSSRKRLFASILLLRGGFSSGKGMFTSKKRKVFIQLREISLKGNKTSNL